VGGGLGEDEARQALRLAQFKLAIKTKIVGRLDHIAGGEA
jgi:ribosomal protein L16/L10AE